MTNPFSYMAFDIKLHYFNILLVDTLQFVRNITHIHFSCNHPLQNCTTHPFFINIYCWIAKAPSSTSAVRLFRSEKHNTEHRKKCNLATKNTETILTFVIVESSWKQSHKTPITEPNTWLTLADIQIWSPRHSFQLALDISMAHAETRQCRPNVSCGTCTRKHTNKAVFSTIDLWQL